MCKFIGKSNERILCKLSKSEILRLYSIVHVAMETTKTSNFTCQSKSLISIFFTCQVSAFKLQPFSCHGLPNDIYWKTANTVFSHLKWGSQLALTECVVSLTNWPFDHAESINKSEKWMILKGGVHTCTSFNQRGSRDKFWEWRLTTTFKAYGYYLPSFFVE